MKITEPAKLPQVTPLLLEKKCRNNCEVKITLEEGNRVRGYIRTADSYESIPLKGMPHFLAKEDVSKVQKLLEDSFVHLHARHIEVLPKGLGGMMNPPERREISDAVAILQRNDPADRVLDLRGKQVVAEELPVLANALATNTSVQVLVLSHNQIGSGSKPVNIFVTKKARGSRLPNTRASSPQKELEGISALSTALIRNRTLRELHISSNGISETSLIVLLQVLAVNQNLCSLDISHNDISDSVGQAVAEAIKANSGLTCLNISSHTKTFLDEGALTALAFASKNTTLRYLVCERGQLAGNIQPRPHYERCIQLYLERNRQLAEMQRNNPT